LAPAGIKLTLNTGQAYERVCSVLPGSPQSPLLAEEWLGKARECAELAEPGIDQARLSQLLGVLERLDELPTLEMLWNES
jgi:hypothetical protein